jgi:hypothetical protein
MALEYPMNYWIGFLSLSSVLKKAAAVSALAFANK